MTYKWDISTKAMEKWTPLAKKDEPYTYNIFGAIGEDMFGDGVTLNAVDKFLGNAQGQDVTFNINSPGGDMFEGLAIYNRLKDYEGNVTVKIYGIAASAASLIAMAGKDILVPENGYIMIHKAWTILLGNADDMREMVNVFDKFDESQSMIYQEKTGKSKAEIDELMANETYLNGIEAVEMGFATGILGESAETEEKKDINALKKLDIALAKGGMTRKERRELIKELNNTQNAVNATQNAGNEEELTFALMGFKRKLSNLLKGE